MNFVYFKNPENSEVFAYDQQQIDDGWVEPGLVPLTNEEVALHLNPPVTREQLIADADAEKQARISQANEYMNSKQWPGKAAIGRLKGDELSLYNLWLDYLDELESIDISTTLTICWPSKPSL